MAIRITQIAPEFLAGNASRIRITQVANEYLVGNASRIRITQLAVEYLIPTATMSSRRRGCDIVWIV